MWVKWYCDKEKMDEVIATLREYLAILTDRTNILRNEKGMNEEEQDLFRTQAKQMDRVYRLVENFASSINHGETAQTENEQLLAIHEFLKKEVGKHARYSYYDPKDMVKALKNFYADVVAEKQRAFGLFATLADDQRIKLLALQFMLEQALYGSTHNAKNARINQVKETIQTIVENLGRIDTNDPQSYHWNNQSSIGNWSYIQTLRDMHYQRVELENLRKENEQLKKDNAALAHNLTPEKEEVLANMIEEEIPFN